MRPTLKQIADYLGVTDRTLKNWRHTKPNLYRLIMRCYGIPGDCTKECSGMSVSELMKLKEAHKERIQYHQQQIDNIEKILLAVTGADTEIVKERVRQTIQCAEGILSDENGGKFIDEDKLGDLYKSGYFDCAKIMIVDIAAMRKAAKTAGNRKWVYSIGVEDCMQFRVDNTIYWAPRPC